MKNPARFQARVCGEGKQELHRPASRINFRRLKATMLEFKVVTLKACPYYAELDVSQQKASKSGAEILRAGVIPIRQLKEPDGL
jgi:hypothetical protein